MKVTAAQIAQLISGHLEGNPDAAVSRPARIEEAGENDFAFLDNPKYEAFAYTTRAAVLLVHSSFQPTRPVHSTLIRVDDVRSSLAFLLEKFQNGLQESGHYANGKSPVAEQASVHAHAQLGPGTRVGQFAVIEEGAVIGMNCDIGPQVYIGRNVHIGDNCRLLPGVRIHADCILGDNCILHSNVVIGSDGFGYAPQDDGAWKKLPHVGNVVLENNVEIGACTCIDRASLGSTLIREGVKIDNLVHIAHNVEVGAHTAMAAQVGVAGSARIGAHNRLGGQTGVAGHISLADHTSTQAQSGLGSSIKKPGQAVFGSPAIPYNEYVRAYVVFKQLPEMQKQVRALEKKLKELSGE